MWNLIYDTDKLVYKTETDSRREDLWLPRGRGEAEGGAGSLGLVDPGYYVWLGKLRGPV